MGSTIWCLEMGILVCLLKWDVRGSPWGLILCHRDGETCGLESAVPPSWCHPLPCCHRPEAIPVR